MFGALLLLSGAFMASCSDRAATVLPGSQTSSTVQSANAFMQSVTPQSVPPNTVPIPPMLGLTGTRPEMSLRKPESQISGLNFTQIAGSATYVAASGDGTFWVLSTSGLPSGDKFIYHYVNGVFANVPGAATRIAVGGPSNDVWVLNAAGGIYHLVNGTFIGVAGAASEISIASDGSAYVISSFPGGSAGRGIYHYTTSTGVFTQLPGAGVTVAASIDGNTYSNVQGVPGSITITGGGFYVTNTQGGIYYYNLIGGWVQLPGGAISLAPTASGGLFALGDPGAFQHGIYYNNLSTGQWTSMPGAAVSLSANSAYVYAIGASGGIYSSPIVAASPAPSPTPTPTAAPTAAPTLTGVYINWTGMYLQSSAGFTSLQTSMTVPSLPAGSSGSISFWPGLQPADGSFVVQPVLYYLNTTFMPNPVTPQFAAAEECCALVNGVADAKFGSTVTVHAGDVIAMSMTSSGNLWTISLHDATTSGPVSTTTYSSGGVLLTNAYFDIETHFNTAIGIPFDNSFSSVTLTNTTVTANSALASCNLAAQSASPTTHAHTFSSPSSSNGGKTCSYATITLYPQTGADLGSAPFFAGSDALLRMTGSARL